MTQSQGDMQEMYPEAGEAYRYRLEEQESLFTFELESSSSSSPSGGGLGQGAPPAITFSIESLPSPSGGEGLFRPSTGPRQAGRTHAFAWAWVGPELHLWLDGALFVFQQAGPLAGSGRRRGNASAAGEPGDVLAPMPGAVLEVLVSEGDKVERNQTVVVMESMKMELLITASRSGVVRRVAVQPGQQVERGMRLLELAPESDSGEQ